MPQSSDGYPLLFATISGVRLCGFPSPDSGFDLCGAHVLLTAERLLLPSPRANKEAIGSLRREL